MAVLVRDRMRLPAEDVGAVVHHARRNPVTGLYEILDSQPIGAGAPEPGLTAVNAPDPNPGLIALGIPIGLELGDEVVVVQTAVFFEGIPRGLGARSSRATWALVPVD
jgi:hypothetical protein